MIEIVCFQDIVEAVLSDGGRQSLSEDRVRFMVSLDRLSLAGRNKMIVRAVVRRLYDEGAGAVVQALLDLAGDNAVSSPVSHGDILKQITSQQGIQSEPATYLDQYLRILQDDRTRFLHKVGDDGGGQS